MKNLIKFELSKLKAQRSFYICTGIMVALIFINALTCMQANKQLEVIDSSYRYFMSDVVIGAASNGAFDLLAGIATAIFVCADYSQRTIGIVIGRGYDRTRVYFSKLIVATVMSTIMYVVALVSGIVFGAAFFDISFDVMPNLLLQLPVQLVSAIALSTLYFLISIAMKRLGAAIPLVIFVPMIVELVLMLIDLFLPFKFHISDFWLGTIFTDLSVLTAEAGNLVLPLLLSLLYVAAFTCAGWLMTRKNSF